MRALAIAFMVLCHFPIFLSAPDAGYTWVYFFSNHVVGDFAAPFFLFLVGLSQAVSQARLPPGAALLDLPRDRTMKRGALIVLCGFLFSLAVRGPHALFEWDVLTLIGTCVLAIRLLRGLPPAAFLGLAAALVLAAPPLRSHSGYVAQWGGSLDPVPGISGLLPGILVDPVDEYAGGGGLRSILTGFFLNGYFPVLPWMAFSLSGYGLGRLQQKADFSRRFDLALGAAGLVGLAAGAALALLGSAGPGLRAVDSYVAPLSFYPDSFPMFLFQLGLTLATFALLRRLCDRSPRETGLRRYLRRLSRYSLTIYVLHHILIFWPLWIMGWAAGSRTMFYEHLCSPLAAFIAGAAFLGSLAVLLERWDRARGRWSLEWILARATPKPG